MKKVYFLVILLFLIACGGGSSNEESSSLQSDESELTVALEGKAQLGVLSEATVKIYELDGLNQKLIATELTSSGDTVESIGNFDVHTEKLNDNMFYLYQVSGGYDYDVDDDGVIDKVPTKNLGVFHLLAKGSSIKAIQAIRATIVSEIAYQKAIPFLEKSMTEIDEALKTIAKEIIEEDINGDGFIGREDVLRFNPIYHKGKLNALYQESLEDMTNNILNGRDYDFEYDQESSVYPTVNDVTLQVDENIPVGSTIGKVDLVSKGDSDILSYRVHESDTFEIDQSGNVKVLIFLNYEIEQNYQLLYSASNHAGEGNPAYLTVNVNDLYEPTVTSYSKDEEGIQKALDNGDYCYVLTQLLNYSERYSDMNEDEISMNIAGAYVGISGYTVYDIAEAISPEGNESNGSFNGFIDQVTKDNNALNTINALAEADKYYSKVVNGLDCSDTNQLTEEQQSSCFNLGLVRLTSLSNSVKLLFGGESAVVEKWASGVETNSSDDLNGNGVTDEADASACAIVYANNPNDSCRDGSIHTYRGKVVFSKSGVDYNTTLIEVDVGSPVYGYNTFYKLTTNKSNNNSPLLTNGVCNRSFGISSGEADGTTYFPCPTLDSDANLMGLKEHLEVGADIQSLFPDGSETKETTENYIKVITGNPNGTVGLDNLSDYLQR